MTSVTFGSHTGTAQLLAERCSLELSKRGCDHTLVSLADFSLSTLSSLKILIIFISTTGNGACPPTALPFFRFLLRSDLPSNLLSFLTFSIFGCGDSSYPMFNAMAKKFQVRMLQLGAKELLARGDGDDQDEGGPWKAFLPWCESLCECLTDKEPIDPGFKFTVHFQSKETPVFMGSSQLDGYLNITDIVSLSDFDPTVWRVGLELCHFVQYNDIQTKPVLDTCLSFKSGDIVELFAWNDDNDVNEFLTIFNWMPLKDMVFTLEPNRPDALFPRFISTFPHVTLFNACKYLLQISHSVPLRSFFSTLAEFQHRHILSNRYMEKLADLGNPLIDDYLTYCYRPKRTVLECCRDLIVGKISGVEYPIELIFEMLAWIQPRSFSISSKPDDYRLSITIALVNYERPPLKVFRRGFFSAWLQSLYSKICYKKADQDNPIEMAMLPFRISRGSFTFPTLLSTPLIFVATGTGIAPFISFLTNLSFCSVPLLLFYGCRHPDQDFLYKEVLLNISNRFPLDIIPVFSRTMGRYVQHVLCDYKDKIVELLSKEASLFVCGNPKLPKAIRNVLVDMIGESDVKNMEKSNRLQIECW